MSSEQSSLSNCTSPELINHTRSKFREKDYEMVKQELLNREEKKQQALNELLASRSKLEDEKREIRWEIDELKGRVLWLEEWSRIMSEIEKRGKENGERLMAELRKKEEEIRVLERERGMRSEELNESLRGRLKELENELEVDKSERGKAKKFKKEDKNFEELEELRRKIRALEHEKEKSESELEKVKEKCEKL